MITDVDTVDGLLKLFVLSVECAFHYCHEKFVLLYNSRFAFFGDFIHINDKHEWDRTLSFLITGGLFLFSPSSDLI